jgi:hypothetical protein
MVVGEAEVEVAVAISRPLAAVAVQLTLNATKAAIITTDGLLPAMYPMALL